MMHNQSINVMATNPGNSDNFIEDTSDLIHSVTENLSNIVYTVYDSGEFNKGRMFGSKGEHWAASYIENLMNEIGLSNVHKEQITDVSDSDPLIENIRNGDGALTAKLDILDLGCTLNVSGDVQNVGCYISPRWNESIHNESYDKELLTGNFSFNNLNIVKAENYSCTDSFLYDVTLGALHLRLIGSNIAYFNNWQDYKLIYDIPDAMEESFQDYYEFSFDTINASNPSTFPSFLQEQSIPEGNFTFIEECPKNNPTIEELPSLESYENYNELYQWTYVVRTTFDNLRASVVSMLPKLQGTRLVRLYE